VTPASPDRRPSAGGLEPLDRAQHLWHRLQLQRQAAVRRRVAAAGCRLDLVLRQRVVRHVKVADSRGEAGHGASASGRERAARLAQQRQILAHRREGQCEEARSTRRKCRGGALALGRRGGVAEAAEPLLGRDGWWQQAAGEREGGAGAVHKDDSIALGEKALGESRAPRLPVEKLSMKRTVLRSSGTVVPPEVTHTIRRVDGCAATKAVSRSLVICVCICAKNKNENCVESRAVFRALDETKVRPEHADGLQAQGAARVLATTHSRDYHAPEREKRIPDNGCKKSL